MDNLNAVINKFQSKKILSNGKEVTIRKLPAMEGIKIGNRLIKVILPAIGGTFDGLRHDDILHGSPKSFSHLALIICDQIDKIGIEDLILKLTEGMFIDGNPVEFNQYFSANYGELVEILEFALRENFGSFFTQNGIIPRLMESLMGMMRDQDSQE